ncbi:hypothetical protein [Mesorhizobium sp. WSM4312]|uniref:hypothetical protein n=1 Tax=Mesorhizobium sp. WSM4312 TaxID=2029411 RepID=UPI0015C7F00A|nr:hypothetical protein [Mesorhizobium sp. WSM4312]
MKTDFSGLPKHTNDMGRFLTLAREKVNEITDSGMSSRVMNVDFAPKKSVGWRSDGTF